MDVTSVEPRPWMAKPVQGPPGTVCHALFSAAHCFDFT